MLKQSTVFKQIVNKYQKINKQINNKRKLRHKTEVLQQPIYLFKEETLFKGINPTYM